MLKHSDDRRARRSRRLLKQGLTELLHEKKFSDISVRDITDRIDMNRGTFYLHYSDTYDLLHSVEGDVLRDAQTMIDEHRGEMENAGSLRPIFSPLLDYVVEHRAVCGSLLGNNASSDFTGRLHQLIYKNGSNLIRSVWPDAPEEKMEYLLSFSTFGLIGLIKRWFDTNMKLSKDDLLARADRLVNGAAEYLMGT
ncbi:MAG: TetR/AcrR family transcriptional regulator [Oscillibacter sp.]|jgi:AcrR family transcriptional regulator|nr:TetR/AcrR family transcriptional regulator [Oscillibacter sp.]